MDTLLKLLKPLFLPLLKVDFRPPHLPEGSSLVRALKPSEKWLGYRYLTVLFGLLNQFIGTGVGAVALMATGQRWAFAVAGLLVVIQCFTVGLALVVARVDFELRHYLVGDRSLRVVQGAWTREEVTLSYANVQNLEVTQGPLERFFGFKSLTISTAGADNAPGERNSHLVSLVGLTSADELRALILNMLKQERGPGLGEAAPAPAALPHGRLLEIREAALALREAARLG